MSNNYLVYKHTSPSNKTYIGITKDYSRRCKEHQYNAKRGFPLAFHAAIRKYGWKQFKHEIVDENLTRQQAEHLEVILIKELNTYAPNGYNLTVGGGGIDGESTRRGQINNRKDSVKGYYWDRRQHSYHVTLGYMGEVLYFGSFKDEEDARAKAEYLFSLSDEELVKAYEEYKAGKASRSRGYTFNKAKGRYTVQLRVDGKQRYFGCYEFEQDAINKAEETRLIIGEKQCH